MKENLEGLPELGIIDAPCPDCKGYGQLFQWCGYQYEYYPWACSFNVSQCYRCQGGGTVRAKIVTSETTTNEAPI